MNSILENWNLLLSRLEQVKQNNKGISALCPCPSHEDKHPSFSASYNDEGISVLCFKGCTFEQIISSLGMEKSQFYTHKENAPPKKIVAKYRYEDKDGDLVHNIVRFEPKDFRPRRSDGKWTLEGVTRVPYRLPQILAGIKEGLYILLLEGEKDCDNAEKLGLEATTFSGGAGKWREEYSKWFQDAKVICIPDNDSAGRKGMHLIASEIVKVAESVRWLELKDIPEKGDLSNWLCIPDNDKKAFEILVTSAPQWDPNSLNTSLADLELGDRLNNLNSVDEIWLEPQEIFAELLPVDKFDSELLPIPLRKWLLDISHRMQVPLDFPSGACVVVMSSIIGTRISICPKKKDTWQVVPNLWGGLIQKPSQLKSPPVKEVLRPMKELETEAFKKFDEDNLKYEKEFRVFEMRKRVCEEKMKYALKKDKDNDFSSAENDLEKLESNPPEEPKLRRYQTQDTTIEKLQDMLSENPQGIFIFRDELNGFLMKMKKDGHDEDEDFHIEGWAGDGSFTLDRIGRGTVRSELICESIFGTIQPTRIIPHIRQTKSDTKNSGFIQRFQIMVYPDSENWEYIDKSPNIEASRRAFKCFKEIAQMDFRTLRGCIAEDNKMPYMRFSDDAQELFIAWLHELQEKLSNPENSPIIREHFGKYRSLMPSLALQFHLIDIADGMSSGPVSLSAAQMAAAWCEYLESHARRIYGMAEDITERAAAIIANRIKAGKLENNFTAREVQRKGWELLAEKVVVKAALQDLVEAKWLREKISSATSKGGPKIVEYEINPKILNERSA
jgi:putative DNA primase/helicase